MKIIPLWFEAPRHRWRHGWPVNAGGAWVREVGDWGSLRGFYVRVGSRCCGLAVL